MNHVNLAESFDKFKRKHMNIRVQPGFYRLGGIDSKGRKWVYKHGYVNYQDALKDAAKESGETHIWMEIEYNYN